MFHFETKMSAARELETHGARWPSFVHRYLADERRTHQLHFDSHAFATVVLGLTPPDPRKKMIKWVVSSPNVSDRKISLTSHEIWGYHGVPNDWFALVYMRNTLWYTNVDVETASKSHKPQLGPNLRPPKLSFC